MSKYWIAIGDKRYSRDWMDKHADVVQRSLDLARNNNVVPMCLCRTAGVPMYIARRKLYYLARYPGTGEMHRIDCPSYEKNNDLSHGPVKTVDAVVKKGSGIQVRLNTAVEKLDLDQVESTPSQSNRPHKPHNKQYNSIKILGFLQLLWEETGLNFWSPAMTGKRHYGVVRHALSEIAKSTKVQNGMALDKLLFIPPAFNWNQRDEHRALVDQAFKKTIRSARNSRIIVMGLIKDLMPSKYGVGLSLKHAHHLRFWMSEKQAAHLRQSYLLTDDDLNHDDNPFQYFAIMTAEVTKNNNCKVTSVVAMRMSEHFIPFDSRYEYDLSEYLIDQHRMFSKPLRYTAESDETLADFVLLDVSGGSIQMEVYGVTGNDDYDRRKKEKHAIYKKQYGQSRYWYWDVGVTKQWPDLPV